ncbi:hypothetical protein D8S78_23025 [Natrialba swarupiae]|nr:hypothetical protein [Natrialba swarupiae]
MTRNGTPETNAVILRRDPLSRRHDGVKRTSICFRSRMSDSRSRREPNKTIITPLTLGGSMIDVGTEELLEETPRS